MRYFGLVAFVLSCLFCLGARAQTAATTTISASPVSGSYGTAVTLSGAVSPAAAPALDSSGGVLIPTGTIQFLDGTTPLSTPPTSLVQGSSFTTTPFSSFFGTLDPAFSSVTGQLEGDLNGDSTQDLLVYMNVRSGSVLQQSIEVETFLSNA